MEIVIATAEPFGAYHLTALSEAMNLSPHNFTHLIPYPTFTQGESSAAPVADLDIIKSADRIILSGGGLTPWTYAVALVAAQQGKPVWTVELAYGTIHPQPFKPERLSALNGPGREMIAASFGVPESEIILTGNPQLDNITQSPRTGPILLTSSSEIAWRDPNHTLRAVGLHLKQQGHDVVVGMHPREDPTYWEGFEAASPGTEARRTASLTIAYPGSVWSVLAAAGIPIIGLDAGTMLEGIPTWIQGVASDWAKNAGEAVEIANGPLQMPAQEDVDYVCGPRPGAAQRIIEYMTSE